MIEQEADNAEVGLSLWEIGIGAGGHARRENFRIDGEVEQGEVTPVTCQKRLKRSSASMFYQLSLPERKISTEISRATRYTCP